MVICLEQGVNDLHMVWLMPLAIHHLFSPDSRQSQLRELETCRPVGHTDATVRACLFVGVAHFVYLIWDL